MCAHIIAELLRFTMPPYEHILFWQLAVVSENITGCFPKSGTMLKKLERWVPYF
jgi:hypothetical protein